jgi:hypothetical protein
LQTSRYRGPVFAQAPRTPTARVSPSRRFARPPAIFVWEHRQTAERRADEPPSAEAAKWKKLNLWRRVNLWDGHDYYYDCDGIREPYKPESLARRAYIDRGGHTGARRGEHQPKGRSGAAEAMPRGTHSDGGDIREGKYYEANPQGRNRRSVWELPTARFEHAHFATYPEELVQPCIMAGTSEAGCCAECGAPLTLLARNSTERRRHQPSQSASACCLVVGCIHGIAGGKPRKL